MKPDSIKLTKVEYVETSEDPCCVGMCYNSSDIYIIGKNKKDPVKISVCAECYEKYFKQPFSG